jgi:hypothetical protein
MATGDVKRYVSQGALVLEVEIDDVVDATTVDVQLPDTASSPVCQVQNDVGLYVSTSHTFSLDKTTNILTYTNGTGGNFTGTLVISFVM